MLKWFCFLWDTYTTLPIIIVIVIIVLLLYGTTDDLENLKVWQKEGPLHKTAVSPEATLVTWTAEVKGDPAKM